MKKVKCGLFIVVVLVAIMIGVINFKDFAYGYFCDVVEHRVLADAGCIEEIEMPEEGYEIKFIPQEDYFTGFQMIFTNVV